MLHRKLVPLHRRTSPFAPGPLPAGNVQWVTPKLVAQIGFAEWTGPACSGTRATSDCDDKAARDVRREEPRAGGGAARRPRTALALAAPPPGDKRRGAPPSGQRASFESAVGS